MDLIELDTLRREDEQFDSIATRSVRVRAPTSSAQVNPRYAYAFDLEGQMPSYLAMQRILLVRDRGRRAVELRNADRKRLIVRLGAILQDAERDLFPQQDRPVSRTAEVYARVNSMTNRYIVSQLVQLTVEIQTIPVSAGVSV